MGGESDRDRCVEGETEPGWRDEGVIGEMKGAEQRGAPGSAVTGVRPALAARG